MFVNFSPIKANRPCRTSTLFPDVLALISICPELLRVLASLPMQPADQNKNLEGREHHCSSSTTAKSTTCSSALLTSSPLLNPSSLPSSSSLTPPSTTDAASPTPPIAPSPQLSIEPIDYTLKPSRPGSEPLVCADFGPISLSAIDPYHLLTPGDNHSSHNFEPESTMLMTIPQDCAQENLERQVQENQLWLQTAFLHNQFHPQQLLPVMHPSSHLQPFLLPPLTQLSSSPSPSASSLPPPLPPTALTLPSPPLVAPLSAPHLIQYEHSHYDTHPNQQQPATLQQSTSGIEPFYQQYHNLSPQQQQSMLQQQTQQLPLQQYQNGGSHEKRGQFFPWPASATAMTPLPGNFGPLPLANTGTLTSTANPRITSRPFQTVAYTGLAAAAKHNTKRAADDMPASE
ncbi:hypothetical protein BCR41DRAFT_403483, partial [Lobosporangium transversale]